MTRVSHDARPTGGRLTRACPPAAGFDGDHAPAMPTLESCGASPGKLRRNSRGKPDGASTPINRWGRNRTNNRPVQIVRFGIEQNFDLCKSFSCTSRVSVRISLPMPPRCTVWQQNRTENRPVQIFQLHKAYFRPTFSLGPVR